MRIIKTKILACVMICSLLITSTAFAKENDLLINKDTTKQLNNIITNNYLEILIENNVYSLTNSEVTINKIIQLYDVNGAPNYVLAVFDKGGYAIVTSKNAIVSECSLQSGNEYPYKNYINSGLIYAGPSNYIVEENNKYIDSNTGKTVDFSVTDEMIKKNDDVINRGQNQNQLLKTSTAAESLVSATATTWTGIASSRFARYVAWENPDNTCGTYASAVMLAYLDDYVDDSFVPSSVRTRNSTSPGTLITKLKSFIGDDGSGTYPSDLNYGIGNFMDYYSLNHQQSSSELILDDTYLKSSINKGWPAVAGLLAILGSTYGNHWVTVYAYSGEYYKCHNNQGGYDKSIINDWTTGAVWMVN